MATTTKDKDPAQTMLNNLPDKTGKTLSQWHKLLKQAGFDSSSKHGELMKLLKSEYGISHGFANLIALKYRGHEDKPSGDTLTDQFNGKEALKPIYEKLMKAIKKFGKDVEIAPKKAYVSLRRSKQFAIIQPSTRTRIDVGIKLKNVPANARLEASGSFNAMVSHRVRVSSVDDVDAELIDWLQQAYQMA